jgi:hypothetical protein
MHKKQQHLWQDDIEIIFQNSRGILERHNFVNKITEHSTLLIKVCRFLKCGVYVTFQDRSYVI